MTNDNKAKLKTALQKLSEATQELANILDETDYNLSEAAPECLADPEDFAYDIVTFVEDEIQEIEALTEIIEEIKEEITEELQ